MGNVSTFRLVTAIVVIGISFFVIFNTENSKELVMGIPRNRLPFLLFILINSYTIIKSIIKKKQSKNV